jgi:hypothetical protein
MKRYIYCIAIFAMSISFVACDTATPKNEAQDMMLQNPDTTMTENFGNGKQEDNQIQTADTTNHQTVSLSKNDNIDWDKKIIKTADIQLQLNDYKNFNTNIHSSLKNFGAYIADEKQTENDYRIENSITIKVPVDQFDNLVNSFDGDGIKITGENISSEDVTGELVDTKARMQAKMAVRDKYLGLLKQAKNMNEILQVQNEINDIQEDIEAANGRVNYLQHASTYSTINLDYFQYINGSTANDETPDFFTKLSNAFSTGTSVITGLILFCISIWPIILILVFIIIYLKRTKPGKPVKT